MATNVSLYGLMAEFDGPESLKTAAERAYEVGYRRMDAYSPYPIEGLARLMGVKGTRLPRIIFAGGAIGCIGGFLMQWYATVIDYPLNVGGRPFNSWPAYVPITFELTVLFAGLAGVFGMLALNGLPQPYHPVFNVPSFELASRSRFFLCIESADPKFDRAKTAEFLRSLSPVEVSEVEP